MIEIKTEKGEFVVKEYSQDRGKSIAQALLDKFCGRMYGYEFICKLSEATEEDAREVVEERQLELWQKTQGFYKYYDYMSRNDRGISCLESAIESLHSLLTSKGIDINNGNLYLFKKI